jgi:hypothetical protein
VLTTGIGGLHVPTATLTVWFPPTIPEIVKPNDPVTGSGELGLADLQISTDPAVVCAPAGIAAATIGARADAPTSNPAAATATFRNNSENLP